MPSQRFVSRDLQLGRSPRNARRARVIVMSADVELVQTVSDVIATRPLDLMTVGDHEALVAIPKATWSGMLVALLDVDVPGVWDFIAREEQLGGVIFGVTFARRIGAAGEQL